MKTMLVREPARVLLLLILACFSLIAPGCAQRSLTLEFDEAKGRFTVLQQRDINYFWVNPEPTPDLRTNWQDFGGDKVWVVPQQDWRKVLGRAWPPGNDLEGLPWKREAGLNVVKTRVQPVDVMVSRAWRAEGPDVVGVQTKITGLRDSLDGPAVHVWCVGQVVVPQYALLGLGSDGLAGYKAFGGRVPEIRVLADKPSEARVIQLLPGKKGTKVGTMGTWVAAVYRGHVLVRMLAGPIAAKERYADESSVQVFIGSDYWELETQGESRALSAGESLELIERWCLWQRPIALTPEQLGEWIEQRVRQERHTP